MANIKQITLNGTTYNIYDSSAVHTVDAALSSSSTNPVQNKVVKAALDTKGTIIDLGTKTNTSTAGYYTFTVSSTDATALATTHDGIRILCGSGSAYRPSEYLIAFKNGTTAVNGVASTIYTGTVGNADFTSKTVAIVIPTSTSGTGYIQEGECDVDIDELMDEFLFEDEAVSDKDVFLTRQTNHGGATQMYPTMIGATMAWNQLIQNGDFASSSKWVGQASLTINSISGNKCNCTISSPSASNGIVQSNMHRENGHKYFLTFTLTASGATNASAYLAGTYMPSLRSVSANTRTAVSWIFSPSASSDGSLVLYCNYGNQLAAGATVVYENAYMVDLTLDLTPAIADYAYSLEQSTAGSGIAWLKSHGFLTKDYYPNNTGSLQSVMPSGSVTTGKNLLETTASSMTENGVTWTVNGDGTITVSGTATGYTGMSLGDVIISDITHPITVSANLQNTTRICWAGVQLLKKNGTVLISNLLSVEGTTAPFTFNPSDYPEAYKLRVIVKRSANNAMSGTIKPQVEIGSTATAFVPFVSHTYPISQTELRGVYKLDSSNNLYADGDIRYSDGTVTRKHREVTYVGAASENWSLQSINSYNIANFYIVPPAPNINSINGGIVSNRFLKQTTLISVTETEGIYLSSNTIYVRIQSSKASTVAELKTWLSNNNLTISYELATPTTEQTPSFQSPQVIYDSGTQTYTDTRDVPVPVCQEATYMSDSRSTLQQIITTPSTDGKYHLVSNVTGGTPEYVWESNTSSDFYASIAGGTGVGLSATIDSFSLYTGVSLILKLTSDATNSNGITLAINDGHGTSYSAKSITYQGDAIKMLAGNRAYTLAYNGTSFDIVGDLNNLHYCECIDSAGTIAKSAGGTHGFVLKRGQVVEVWFANGNTATGSITLNIGGTGAKSIMQYGSTNITGLALASGAIVTFVYDGTYWRVVSISDKSGVPVWGLSTNGGAVHPYSMASGSSIPAGNVAIISPALSGEAVKIASGKAGNIVVAQAISTAVSSAPAGSTSYTTGDSNWALPDGTVSFMLDYYFQCADDNSAAPQKPTSVVKNNDGTLTLTFASSLNPSSAVTKLYATTYMAAGSNISAANGASITSTSNLVVGSFITTAYGTVVAGQKISNTGLVSALIGARLKNTANYSILAGSDNLNAKAYAAIFGQGHDSTNGPAAVTAVGKYSNITSTSAFVVGNGTSTSARSNAFEVTTGGVAKAGGRRVVTSPDSTAVGNVTTPVYIDTNGYPQTCSLESGFAKKENSHYYGICNTAAATAAKEVTVQYAIFDTPNLVEGTTIAVKFVNGNTAGNIALSVNGLTSSFVIKRKNTSSFDTVSINMPANAIYEFTYDGTYWNINVGALSISASAQTVPSSAESFSDNITLHKVSKTGSFSDLLNKPSATVSGLSTSKTLTALSETDGVISATVADIAIAGSQVTSGNIAAARMPTGYMKEAYLEWGGKNFSAGNGPLDAALINTLGADRFAFIPAACTTVEYSTDAGATWQDYGLSDSNKVAVFAPGLGVAVYLGKHTTAGSGTANDQLRITVDTYSGSQRVYSTIKKFVMYGSTNGAANTTWSLQVRTTANVLNNVDTWGNVFTDVAWGGWSGINIAQTDVTIGSNAPTSTSNTQYRQFRLIFKQGTPSASYASSQILYIMGYGGVGWSTPSNMAKLGSIYTYDVNQNVAFPARVKATELKGLGANYYGTCTTPAATGDKVVTCTDFVLTTGARISINFTNGNTTSSILRLNVNSTGLKEVRQKIYNGTMNMGARCNANAILDFIYDGTYWIICSPYNLRNNFTYASRPTSANRSYADLGLEYFLATSTMTTGKPPVDSQIIGLHWDNGQNYAAQLAVAHGGNTSATESYAGRLFARGQRMGDGTWSTWYEFPRYSVLPSDGDIIVSEDAAGAARIKGISTLPSSKVVADDAHSMMYNGSTIMLADPTDDYKLGKGPAISLLDQASYLRHDGSWVTPPNTDTSGSIYGATIYEDGTSLTNKYAPKSHTHTLDQVYNDSTTEGRTVASGDRLLIASVGGSDSSGVVKSPSTLAFTSDTSQFLRHDGTFAEPVLSGANVTVTSTAAKATNDVIPIADASDSYKLKNMSITLDTSDTATFLCHDGSWSTPYYIRTIGDQRSTGTTPNTYKNQLAFLGLKGKATINNPSTDTYSYLLGLRGWSDSSGGNAWELAFNNTGIFARTGASTTWGNWQQLVTSTNYNTWAAPKSHTHTLDQIYNDSTTTSRTVESGDRILIASVGGSDSSGLVKSPSALALGSDTTKFLCNNGTWAVPTGTDTKVTQTAVTGTSTTTFYPILLAKSTGQTATTTDTANFTANASVTPSGDLTAVNVTVTESFKYGANAHTTYNSTLKAIEFIFD